MQSVTPCLRCGRLRLPSELDERGRCGPAVSVAACRRMWHVRIKRRKAVKKKTMKPPEPPYSVEYFERQLLADKLRVHMEGECAGIECCYCDFRKQFGPDAPWNPRATKEAKS